MQSNDPSVPGEPHSATPPPAPEPGAPPPAEPGASATPPQAASPEPPPMPPSGGATPDPSTPTYNFGALPPPKIDPPPTKDDRMWGLITHLGGALGGFTYAVGIPGGNILIPLIVWLIKKDGSPFLNDQGKEVLNFQICILVASLVFMFSCVLAFMVIPVGLASLVFGIVGCVKANEGVAYRYPINFRIIK
jgi:uncharacterized Tic20 family protein